MSGLPQVRCPACRRRLFDAAPSADSLIEIKCTCRRTVEVRRGVETKIIVTP